MPTKLLFKDLDVQGPTITISGASGTALAQSLISKNSHTIGEIAHALGYIDPAHITIAPNGAIQIENQAIATKLAAMKATAGPAEGFIDTNCQCSNT